MEFRLDEGQVALQETVRRFCEARFPLDRIAERELQPVDRPLWKELGELGVLGLLLPEADGGSGLGVVEAAVVFEQLGSQLVPGPALWSVLSAPLVDGAATGDRLVGGADLIGAPLGPSSVVVEHAADLDALVVLRDDGVFVHLAGGLPTPGAAAPLDPLTPVGRYDRLPDNGGAQVGGPDDVVRLRLVGAVLAASGLLGVSDQALDVARTYAHERQQFGVPIGSFQAVKHMLADMYVRTGLARSATYAAAAVLDDPGAVSAASAANDASAASRAVAAAKLLAGEAAIANASTAIQVLGGMGFTWAMLPNYLLKRAWVLEQSFGDVDEHALALGEALAVRTPT